MDCMPSWATYDGDTFIDIIKLYFACTWHFCLPWNCDTLFKLILGPTKLVGNIFTNVHFSLLYACLGLAFVQLIGFVGITTIGESFLLQSMQNNGDLTGSFLGAKK